VSQGQISAVVNLRQQIQEKQAQVAELQQSIAIDVKLMEDIIDVMLGVNPLQDKEDGPEVVRQIVR